MAISVKNPYEATTTMSIDIANRLYSLRAHPGFNDLVRLSERTVKVAEDAFVMYEGWDKDELNARSIAFRSARRFHEMLWGLMENTIQNGIAESRQAQEAVSLEDPYGEEAANMADHLRVAVLKRTDESYDSRVSGTY